MTHQARISSPDPYGRTFQMDVQTLEAIAARLEARKQHPLFLRAIDDYMDALALAGPEAILDLGCGTGVAARVIARRPEVAGPITAVDVSGDLVARGRHAAEAEGLGGRIDFRVGDAHGLAAFADAAFDVVVMHTLISHVAEPATVLAEARRLLRPGGRLVVFDGDYASTTFATDAPDGGAATDRIVQEALIAHPRVMRAMPRLLVEAGFALRWSRGWLAMDIGQADVTAPGLPSLRVLLPRTGAMTQSEADAYVDGLERASAENRFFGGYALYACIATRGVG
ncbi:methyltransferase domain-containing protein [Inquilinus limosus]|uniref:methyltransferase domain-containing protein n=1 Tax=Inquilinus limosus TaxID=171674 RepID=UPI003F175C6C